MADKAALRELQSRLAERLQAARTAERPAGWLAVEAAGHGFLLPLSEAGEIFQGTPVTQVPYTARWFVGVANLRGVLMGVVDLAAFLGLREGSSPNLNDLRLIAFNPVLDLNAALCVDRLAGLRNAEQLSVEADTDPSLPAFAGRRLRDDGGRVWQELRLAMLVRDERFLHIVADADA